jgi:hypothetical protein
VVEVGPFQEGSNFGGEVVPGERIELPTNGLQNRCSTAELTRQTQSLRVYGGGIAVGSPPGATSRSGYHRLGTLANAAFTILAVHTSHSE